DVSALLKQDEIESLEPAQLEELVSKGLLINKLERKKQEELVHDAINNNKTALFKAIYNQAQGDDKNQMGLDLLNEKWTAENISQFLPTLDDWGVDITDVKGESFFGVGDINKWLSIPYDTKSSDFLT